MNVQSRFWIRLDQKQSSHPSKNGMTWDIYAKYYAHIREIAKESFELGQVENGKWCGFLQYNFFKNH